MRRFSRVGVVLLVAMGLGVLPAYAAIPTAQPSPGNRTVGALFPASSSGVHTCTATVLRSRHGNLVITAAHCIHGTGLGMEFAPGYANGKSPYGQWRVIRAYADPRWLGNRNPLFDYAILRVANQTRNGHSVSLQHVVGGHLLGRAPFAGRYTSVYAYNAAVGGGAVHCSAPVYYHGRYPAFDCHGFVGGSSGSAFLVVSNHTRYVRGVIGGLHQGGCHEYTSYSSPFTLAVFTVLRRANAGRPSDVLPPLGPDGC